MGESTRKLIRPALVERLKEYAPETFSGCTPGKGVGLSSHAVGEYLSLLKLRNLSGGVVYFNACNELRKDFIGGSEVNKVPLHRSVPLR